MFTLRVGVLALAAWSVSRLPEAPGSGDTFLRVKGHRCEWGGVARLRTVIRTEVREGLDQYKIHLTIALYSRPLPISLGLLYEQCGT